MMSPSDHDKNCNYRFLKLNWIVRNPIAMTIALNGRRLNSGVFLWADFGMRFKTSETIEHEFWVNDGFVHYILHRADTIREAIDTINRSAVLTAKGKQIAPDRIHGIAKDNGWNRTTGFAKCMRGTDTGQLRISHFKLNSRATKSICTQTHLWVSRCNHKTAAIIVII